jgi:hypothetical protein
MRFLLSMCVLTGLTFGQTYEVKDRHGIPVVKVFNVKLFRHSDYLKEDFPAFEAAITNVSGQDLHPVPLNVTIHLKQGTTTDFLLTAEGVCSECDFRRDATFNATHAFLKPWPYTPETFESIEFSLSNSFLSPEDGRLLAEYEAKKDAELAKEQAEERQKVRAACALIYKNTANKKVGDLTVKEQQQVRECQALDLYPPR